MGELEKYYKLFMKELERVYYHSLMKLINDLRNSDSYFKDYYVAKEAVLKTWKFTIKQDGRKVYGVWEMKTAEEICEQISNDIQDPIIELM